MVRTPLDASYQADIIRTHSLEAGGGKTYAERDRADPAGTVVTATPGATTV